MNYGYFLAYATILTLCHVVPDCNRVSGRRSRTSARSVLRDVLHGEAQAFQAGANTAHLLTKQNWKIICAPIFLLQVVLSIT